MAEFLINSARLKSDEGKLCFNLHITVPVVNICVHLQDWGLF